MHGTWKVTGGAGAGGGAAIGAALAAAYGVAWALAHLLWILGTGAVCAVLTGAAVTWLARLADRRDAARAARGPLMVTRDVPAELPPPQRLAIAPQVVNFNFYGADAARAAAIIRQAIPGAAGDADSKKVTNR